MFPWSLLFSFLGNLLGTLGEYFKKKQDIELANVEVQRQLALANVKAASDQSISADNRAVESLKVTGTNFKYCVFWLISSPFIACLLGQTWYAQMVFANLAALPQWYMLLYSGIIGVIWGIPVPGSVMGNIWEGIKNSAQTRRDYKLEKAKINRDAVFASLRKDLKTLNQKTVNIVDHALDEGEGKENEL